MLATKKVRLISTLGRSQRCGLLFGDRLRTWPQHHPPNSWARDDVPNMPARKQSKTSKRTLIEPHKGDKRYARRNKTGEFKKEVDVGRSLAADRRSKAKTKVSKGQGDRGDVNR